MPEDEIKTEAKLSNKITICDPEHQSKDKCSEFEAGRRNGNTWCFWFFPACKHCGNPKVQSYCLQQAQKWKIS
jgi:hypothetical protein